MKIRATVTKGNYVAGVEYGLSNSEAMAMIVAGNAEHVTVAPALNREKAVNGEYEQR